ncbi:MAG: DUF4240 domain-containing protein [Limisphaerales bacterium]
MNAAEFWSIVERVHHRGEGVMKRKCEVLAEELRTLTMDEVRSFEEHFTTFYFEAFVWDLWAAATIICEGCGNDSFMDFRSTLVSMGREVYEGGLKVAESLAEVQFDGDYPCFEGYQYVAGKVYREKAAEIGLTRDIDDREVRKHPKEPRGMPFQPWDLERRFPKLCARYGHKDLDWAAEKERHECEQARAAKVFRYSVMVNGEREVKEGRLSALMLDTGMAKQERLTPKFAQVREWMRSGRSEIANDGCDWETDELDEVFFGRR